MATGMFLATLQEHTVMIVTTFSLQFIKLFLNSLLGPWSKDVLVSFVQNDRNIFIFTIRHRNPAQSRWDGKYNLAVKGLNKHHMFSDYLSSKGPCSNDS
jgi:hypothetical protein